MNAYFKLDVLYKEIVERLEMKDEELNEYQKADLMRLAELLNDERRSVEDIRIDIIVNFPISHYYDGVRRLEKKDIPWLKLWKRYYNKEDDVDFKLSVLKWGVCDLVQEDMRRDDGLPVVYTHARQSFEEINRIYAEILDVGTDDVTEAIDILVKQGFVRKMREYGDYVCYVSTRLFLHFGLNYWERVEWITE